MHAFKKKDLGPAGPAKKDLGRLGLLGILLIHTATAQQDSAQTTFAVMKTPGWDSVGGFVIVGGC